MLVLFEVILAPGADPEALFSDETKRDTHAQIMTLDEASKVGFAGLKPDAQGRETRYVAVNRRDAPRIHRTLETHESVGAFLMHEVDV